MPAPPVPWPERAGARARDQGAGRLQSAEKPPPLNPTPRLVGGALVGMGGWCVGARVGRKRTAPSPRPLPPGERIDCGLVCGWSGWCVGAGVRRKGPEGEDAPDAGSRRKAERLPGSCSSLTPEGANVDESPHASKGFSSQFKGYANAEAVLRLQVAQRARDKLGKGAGRPTLKHHRFA